MTYNFYQSDLWRHINAAIYHKPVGVISILGKEYQYVVKTKSVLGRALHWYQILGVELSPEYLYNPQIFREEVFKTLRTTFNHTGDCFVQLGFVNVLSTDTVSNMKQSQYYIDMMLLRQKQESAILRLGGYLGVVENMPMATIMINLKSDLWGGLSRSTRTHIKKAQGLGLIVEKGNTQDWSDFYDIRIQTGDTKGFAIQSHTCYDALQQYLLDSGQGDLYVIRHNGVLIAGAICVHVGATYVYLYGATQRGMGNIGHAQLLHWEIMNNAAQNGYDHYDLLGIAPGGVSTHHLQGVTQFKAGFGGSVYEYIGNFDFPLSQWKYQIFKWYRAIK